MRQFIRFVTLESQEHLDIQLLRRTRNPLVDGHGARVIELSRHNMKAENETDNDIAIDLRVKWRGPVDKWCVVRASDNVVLKAGLVDKNVALENLATIAMERARVGN